MANRYWVGGTGSWSNTAFWSDTSGGAGGFSVPATGDDVFFDAASSAGAYTVTLTATSYSRDLSIGAPASGNLTFSGNYSLNVSGTSFYCAATTVWSNITVGILTSTACTINTNNSNLYVLTCQSGTFNLASDLRVNLSGIASQVNVVSGTFNTNNFTITTAGFSCTGTTARTVNLGTSTISIVLGGSVGWNIGLSTNIVVNAASANIVFSGQTSSTFTGGLNNTYGAIALPSGNNTLYGSNTYASLTWNASTANNVSTLVVDGSNTITGTLNFNGSSTYRRAVVQSQSSDTSTFTCNGTVSGLTDIDFVGITAAGSASWAGTNLGDGGGNVGISGYAAPRNVYFVNATATWTSASSWASAFGGTADWSYFPRPQDTAFFQNGFPSGTTFSNSSYLTPSINATSRTTALAFTTLLNGVLVGTTYTLGSTATFSSVQFGGGYNTTYSGPNLVTATFGYYAKTFSFTLASNLTSTGTLTVRKGNLNLNGFTLTTSVLACSATTTACSITSGATGQVNLNSTSSAPLSLTSTTLNITDKLQVNLTAATSVTRTLTCTMPGSVPIERCPSVTVSAGTGIVTLFATTGTRYNNITFTSGFTGSMTRFGATTTIGGDFTLHSGMLVGSTGSGTVTWQVPAGQTRTWTSAGKTFANRIYIAGDGVHQLGDALNSVDTLSGLNITGSGTFKTNNYPVTLWSIGATGSGNRTFDLGTSTITLSATTTIFNEISSGTSTYTGDHTFVFAGSGTALQAVLGGKSVNRITVLSAAVTQFYGGGGIAELNATSKEIRLQVAQTFTIGALNINGVSGALSKLTATSTQFSTLSKSSGTVDLSYVNVSYINAVGGATFKALLTNGNVDGGGNIGWTFTESAGEPKPLAGSSVSDVSAVAAANVIKACAGSIQAASTATAALAQDVLLGGSATSATSSVGSIDGVIPLAAIGAASSTGTAALSQGVPLQGSSVVASTSTAALAQGVLLAGSAAASTSTTTALTVVQNVFLSGSLSVAATAAGTVALSAPLASSVAAQTAASAALTQATPLQGTAVAVATVAPSLAKSSPLAGSAATSVSVAGGLGLGVGLAATVGLQITADANIVKVANLQGALVVASSGTASLDTTKGLSANAVVQAQTSAALNTDYTLAGAAFAATDITAALSTPKVLGSTVSAVSSATAEVGKSLNLGATVQSVSTASAAVGLNVTLGGYLVSVCTPSASFESGVTLASISGLSSVTNVLSASLAVSKPIAGSASVESSASPSLGIVVRLTGGQYAVDGYVDDGYYVSQGVVSSATAKLANALAASASAVSSATGSLAKASPLAASAVAVSSATANTSVLFQLAASAASQATATAALGHQVPLAAAVSASSTASGGLTRAVNLTSAVAAVSIASANAVVNKPLAATASCVSSTTGSLAQDTSLGGLSGVGAISNIASATLQLGKPFAANVTCLTVITGGLAVGKSLAGSAQSVVSHTADLTALNLVAAEVAATATAYGSLGVAKSFAGQALALATVNGVLVYSHINDLESITQTSADIEVDYFYADATLVTPTASVSATSVSLEISSSELMVTVQSGQIFAEAELVGATASVETQDLYLYKQAA